MSISDALQEAAQMAADLGQPDIAKKIAEIQAELFPMMGEYQRLQREVGDLQQKIKMMGEMVFEKNSYWRNVGGRKDGPLCSVCWDSNQRLVQLHKLYPNRYQCPACKTNVTLEPPDKPPV